MNRLQDELRRNYLSGHSAHVSGTVYQDLKALWPYFERNYMFLLGLPRDAVIVEIGSGNGSLVAWLAACGFTNVTGLDISQEEVDRANQRGLPLVCEDAQVYLTKQEESTVDVVIAKAMFEHLPKQEGADLLKAAARALKPNRGIVVLDVPNMDWLLANHERYMDLTHYVGYTRESMGQMLRLYFDSVEINGSREAPESMASRIRINLAKPLLVRLLRAMFRIMGEGAANVLFESRSIIAIGKLGDK